VHGDQPPVYAEPSRPPRRTARLALALVGVVLVVAVVAVVLANGDGRSGDQGDGVIIGRKARGDSAKQIEPDRSVDQDAVTSAASKVAIVGAPGGDETDVVAAAIVDIQKFWTDELPRTFGEDYVPVEGGFFSWSPGEELPPCADSSDNITGNAFYCGDADDVAWDDAVLIPHLYETYGDLSVAIVFAHEWGHAIQARVGMQGATVTLEQQADCYAGAWVGHVRDGDSDIFTADGKALDQALAGFLEIADTPGTSAMDPNAHGSAFDRINSFKDGLDEGASTCASYTDENVTSRLVELEFQTQADFDSGGNAPLDDTEPCTAEDASGCGVISLSTLDLEDYWSKVAQQKFGVTWKPLRPSKAFDASNEDPPKCGDSDTEGYTLFYCADGRFVAYDDGEDGLFRDVYASLGDFAVAALYGSQYSLAAEDQLDVAPSKTRDQNLMADCMTGSWAASVFLGDRKDSGFLSLSPGDFDEAVKVLLALGSDERDGGTQGSGFERVSSFRDGVVRGIEACTTDK
jgi:predicted metalloprotease